MLSIIGSSYVPTTNISCEPSFCKGHIIRYSLLTYLLMKLQRHYLGSFLRIIHSGNACLTGAATFSCTNHNGYYANWDIQKAGAVLYSFSFAPWHHVGSEHHGRLESSALYGRISFKNSSLFISILQISGIDMLISSTIACNSQRLLVYAAGKNLYD